MVKIRCILDLEKDLAYSMRAETRRQNATLFFVSLQLGTCALDGPNFLPLFSCLQLTVK